MMLLVFTVALSFALSQLFCSRHSPLNVLDAPNGRSLHDVPVPRTGGIGIVLALMLTWAFLFWEQGMPSPMATICIAMLLVAGVSFADDVKGLPAWPRLAVHAVAATLVVGGGVALSADWVGYLVSWFVLVWMINLYNFMDGMDGFAGGMAVFGFTFLGLGASQAEAGLYALLCWSVAAAALGFLWFNLPPARIFMGDVGATTLGLLAAIFGLWGVRDGLFSWWFPLLIFSPFVVDATVTLTRRALQRERFWEPHCSHYYQKLVRQGWGHKKTVLAEYTLMILTGLSALLAHEMGWSAFTIVVLSGWCVIFLLIIILVYRMEKAVSQ